MSDNVPGAAAFVPRGAGLDQLRQAALGCQGCELHGPASQTVFSKGMPSARIVFVGEQPGDQEDRQGLPFVGPAGMLFDRALAEAGIERQDAYVTNSVKHFRFTQTGPTSRRIHKTPEMVHVNACKPWLLAELAILDPEVVVALGATAAKAVIGPDFRVMRDRGRLMPRTSGREFEPGAHSMSFLLGTVHPSAVLRADDQDTAFAGLVADLKVVAGVLV
jgi:DNA polymerase